MAISFPVDPDDPQIIAAEERTLAGEPQNVTFGGLIDARVDGTNRHGIGDDGTAFTRAMGEFYACDAGLSGEMPLSTSYGAGEVMTAGFGFSLAPGVYCPTRIKALTTSGSDLPAGFSLALVNYDSANAPTWQTDGDTFVPSLTGGTGLEALAMEWVGAFAPTYGTQRQYVISDGSCRAIHINPGMDSLRLIPFTTDASGSFDPGELLLIIGILERMGDPVIGA